MFALHASFMEMSTEPGAQSGYAPALHFCPHVEENILLEGLEQLDVCTFPASLNFHL